MMTSQSFEKFTRTCDRAWFMWNKNKGKMEYIRAHATKNQGIDSISSFEPWLPACQIGTSSSSKWLRWVHQFGW